MGAVFTSDVGAMIAVGGAKSNGRSSSSVSVINGHAVAHLLYRRQWGMLKCISLSFVRAWNTYSVTDSRKLLWTYIASEWQREQYSVNARQYSVTDTNASTRSTTHGRSLGCNILITAVNVTAGVRLLWTCGRLDESSKDRLTLCARQKDRYKPSHLERIVK